MTIAGESAGGLSVLYLMSSPPARGLFHRAIAESAYMISMPELSRDSHGMPSGEAGGTALSTALHADLPALRAMDPRRLTDAAAGAHFAPFAVVDGQVLPEQMVTAFDAGRQAHVPVLIGFNQGEIRSLRMLAPGVPPSVAFYEGAIRERYGDLADQFLRLYPSSNMGESVIATTRDALYGWTAERVARRQTAAGQPAYLYLFDHGYPAADSNGLHAFHASELPYVFGTTNRTTQNWPPIPQFPRETTLSNAMIDYWASFVRDGTPRAANAPDWPRFDAQRSYIHFTDTPRAETQLMPGMYELNEAVVCRRLAAGTQPWNWNAGLWSGRVPPAAECPTR